MTEDMRHCRNITNFALHVNYQIFLRIFKQFMQKPLELSTVAIYLSIMVSWIECSLTVRNGAGR